MLEFGVSSQQFQADYLERKPYLYPAALAERPMQWRDIDVLLHGMEDRPESMQLFNNGQIPPHTYLEQSYERGRQRTRLNKHRFYALLEQGATLVLNRVEEQSLAAQRLCAEVSSFVTHPTTGNAYISFGGNGTFGKHWDTHDVFAVQLLGRKRWQVFAPTLPLPLPHQTSEAMRHTCPSVPVLDCVLDTGDLLYIPRGWWHQVTPFDEGSLHLSVGAYLPSVSDYLQWTISRKLAHQLEARRSLTEVTLNAAPLAALLQTFTQALLEPATLAEFHQELRSRERLNSEFDLDLFVNNPKQPLPADVRIMLNSLQPANSNADIRINGGRMQLEPLSRAIVQLLHMTPTATLGELQNQLPKIPTTALRAALMDLVRHEVLRIDRS